MNKKIFTLMLVALLGWQIASAQWNSNAAENTRYTDLSGEQVIPKIAVCTDGFAYIAWFSNHTGNYNVYLQRIDKDGNPQWPNNGILISDNTQDSWLTNGQTTASSSAITHRIPGLQIGICRLMLRIMHFLYFLTSVQAR